MDSSNEPRPHAKWVRHGVLTIQDPEVSERLDRYLSHRFKYRSRTQWVRMIEEGRIRVNGRSVRVSQRIKFGDQIEYIPRKTTEPDVCFDWKVLQEDETLLVIDKPANLPVHPSGRYFRNTLLVDLLLSRGESLDKPGVRIVHRLDRETSGIVLFGKDRLSTSRLAIQFEKRGVRKEYLLLVHGVPAEDRFTVDAALGRNEQSRVRKAMGVVEDGLSARTEFEVVSRGPRHALLRARPLTGRFHQIRVHTRHAGYPIVGDKLYGLDEEFFLKMVEGREYSADDRDRLLLNRQGLHAHSLTVRHPASKEPITFVAPLPADMRAIAESLQIDLLDCEAGSAPVN